MLNLWVPTQGSHGAPFMHPPGGRCRRGDQDRVFKAAAVRNHARARQFFAVGDRVRRHDRGPEASVFREIERALTDGRQYSALWHLMVGVWKRKPAL
jgi:hypothetical protein